MKPYIADLFCGAGGAAMGYWQAGFRVMGCDINPQPNYPFGFVKLDVFKLNIEKLSKFDAIHASPPCQGYSDISRVNYWLEYQKSIPEVREILKATGKPYVIENVAGAGSAMINPILLCGSSFGLRVRRHRLFESNVNLSGTRCDHAWQDQLPCYNVKLSKVRGGVRRSGVMPVYGGNQLIGGKSLFNKSVAMGIHWMNEDEIDEAIPPAFTRFVGRQLIRML